MHLSFSIQDSSSLLTILGGGGGVSRSKWLFIVILKSQFSQTANGLKCGFSLCQMECLKAKDQTSVVHSSADPGLLAQRHSVHGRHRKGLLT